MLKIVYTQRGCVVRLHHITKSIYFNARTQSKEENARTQSKEELKEAYSRGSTKGAKGEVYHSYKTATTERTQMKYKCY